MFSDRHHPMRVGCWRQRRQPAVAEAVTQTVDTVVGIPPTAVTTVGTARTMQVTPPGTNMTTAAMATAVRAERAADLLTGVAGAQRTSDTAVPAEPWCS